jgi:hypothetical protein
VTLSQNESDREGRGGGTLGLRPGALPLPLQFGWRSSIVSFPITPLTVEGTVETA